MSMIPEGKPTKTFWQRPENWTSILVGAGILGGLYFGGAILKDILSNLVGIVGEAIAFVILAAVLGAILFVLLDPKFRTLVWYIYQSLMKQITKIFVEIDPIAIAEAYVEDLKNTLSKMDFQLGKLKGQMAQLKNTISTNTSQQKVAVSIMDQAKQKGMQTAFVLNSRRAGRLEKSNLTLQQLYDKMEFLYRALMKYREVSEALVEDTEDEVNVKKREYKALTAGYSAFRSALSILRGDPNKKQMFDQSMEFMAEDVGNKVGEIEHFLEVSQGFIDSIDLQNGIYEQGGMQMLEDWSKKTETLLLPPGEKKAMEAASADPTNVIDITPVKIPNAIPKK